MENSLQVYVKKIRKHFNEVSFGRKKIIFLVVSATIGKHFWKEEIEVKKNLFGRFKEETLIQIKKTLTLFATLKAQEDKSWKLINDIHARFTISFNQEIVKSFSTVFPQEQKIVTFVYGEEKMDMSKREVDRLYKQLMR